MTHDTLFLHDVNAPQQNRSVKLSPGERARSLMFHPNEKWITAGMRGKVAIFDFEDGELIAYINADSLHDQSMITISDDGKFLATCSENAKDSIKTFEFADAVATPAPPTHEYAVTRLRPSTPTSPNQASDSARVSRRIIFGHNIEDR